MRTNASVPENSGSIGKVEVLAKYAKSTYDFDDEEVSSIGQKTKIFEIGYIIKGFNARVSLFYHDVTLGAAVDDTETRQKVFGLGLQLQM